MSLRYIDLESMRYSRLGLGAASLLWAWHLLGSSAYSEYEVMLHLLPASVWSLLFAVHGLCTVAFVVRNTDVGKWAFLYDGVLGFALWTVSTVCVYSYYWPNQPTLLENVVTYSPPAFLSAQVVVAAYAWWRFILLWAECGGHVEAHPKEHVS